MWEIENRTPFAAERAWVRDRDGSEVWLVAVKCTFDIAPDGSTRICAEQPPLMRAPEYSGEPGASSLLCDADLLLKKTTTDVIAIGHAYAPYGQPVTALDATLCVGPIRKRLRVFGDRVWTAVGASSPMPFVKMPLLYERAYGGRDPLSQTPEQDWDARNPVGTGFAMDANSANECRLPNFEYPDQLIGSWRDRPEPAGFGAVSSHWLPRQKLSGTYDDRWMKERQPLLPEDLDDRFFQCAPADQQTPEFLRGGEVMELHNLSSEPLLRTVLPRVFLRFNTSFATGETTTHPPANLHTVLVDTDRCRVSLVWHSALPCHHQVHRLERTVITVKPVIRPEDLDDESEGPEEQEFAE